MQILLAILFWLLHPLIFASPTKDFLSLDDIAYSMRPKTPGISGFYYMHPHLHSFHDFKDFYYVSTLNEQVKDPTLGFAKIPYGFAESTLRKFPKEASKGLWIGRMEGGDKGYFLADGRLSIVAFDIHDKFIRKSSLILDEIIPAADSRGEPNRYESSAARSRIRSYFDKMPKDTKILRGVVAPPKTWILTDQAQFMATTSLAGFVLTTIKCDEQNWGHCRIMRGCFLEGKYLPSADFVAGIAISANRNLLLIADQEYNRILTFEFHSCHHVVQKSIVHLPEKIHKVTAIHVDDSDRLWVATENQDNFLNASLYIWPASAW